jgi:GntR family transcriptional regulator
MNRYSDNLPLYARIASVIRQRIDSGALAVGVALPTLEALMSEFGASRVTTRQAMGLLEGEALIERRRGAGTTVVGRPVNARSVSLPATWDELIECMQHIERRVIEVDDSESTPQPSDAELAINANDAAQPFARCEQYVRMKSVHYQDDAPYCRVDGWLEKSLYRAAKKHLTKRPVLLVLTERHAECVVDVRQTLTLGLADIDSAALLSIPLGSPVAKIVRAVTDANQRRVFVSHSEYPASVVQLDTVLFQTKKAQ